MNLRYPIKKFTWDRRGKGLLASEAERREWLGEIEATPARLRAAVAELTEAQLDTPYRPAGWTVRQVVHHLADSHLNAYARFRLTLTEDQPTIQTLRPGALGKTAGCPDGPGGGLAEAA
jgi:hypothetical protein